MLYTPLTKKAMKIAFDAHKDQTDKSGVPYIYHPVHLAEQMDDEISVCIALLHDVVEDSGITFEQLSEKGFPDEVISALRLLTHDKAVPYMEYIENLKCDAAAVSVKLADLRHNSDLSRLEHIDENALRRVEKYSAAIKILSSAKKNDTGNAEV